MHSERPGMHWSGPTIDGPDLPSNVIFFIFAPGSHDFRIPMPGKSLSRLFLHWIFKGQCKALNFSIKEYLKGKGITRISKKSTNFKISSSSLDQFEMLSEITRRTLIVSCVVTMKPRICLSAPWCTTRTFRELSTPGVDASLTSACTTCVLLESRKLKFERSKFVLANMNMWKTTFVRTMYVRWNVKGSPSFFWASFAFTVLYCWTYHT